MKENGSSVETSDTKGRKKGPGQGGGATNETDRDFPGAKNESTEDASRFGGSTSDATGESGGSFGGATGRVGGTTSQYSGSTRGGTEVQQRLEQASHTLRDDVETLAHTASTAAQQFGSYVKEQLEERPYATMGAVAGVGFILGGGLTLRMGSLLFGTGGRLIASIVLREVLRPTVQ